MNSIRNLMPRQLIGLLRGLRYPKPTGIGEIGADSYILMPRRIDGAASIRIGARTHINKNTWLSAIEKYEGQTFRPSLSIGNDVYIGQYGCIVCIAKVVIEDACVLSEHVYITDSSHGLDPAAGLIMHQPLVSKGEVHIGFSTFLGYRACVMPGVTLGKHCVVGANSVVTRSFPDFSMIVGSPARLIKTYSEAKKTWVPVTHD